MAVSPQKAKENMTKQELNDIETIEKHIDQFLLDNYMGYAIDIDLPVKVTPRMSIRLTQKYKDVGWKSVSFSTRKPFASFCEYIPSSYQD